MHGKTGVNKSKDSHGHDPFSRAIPNRQSNNDLFGSQKELRHRIMLHSVDVVPVELSVCAFGVGFFSNS
jgi:hypothetical protein